MLKLVGNNFFLRTPLYPFSFTQHCFNEDINKTVSRPEFMYGIYIASKELYEEYVKQLESGKVTSKMKHSLQKYWVRASSRCTPYANFAGCSLGTIGDATDIYLSSPVEFDSVCRLDMDLIYKILEVLYKDARISNQIKYYVNNSLYLSGNQYRYVRYTYAGTRKYFLSEADNSPYLKDLLALCERGASINEMEALITTYGFDEEEVKDFVSGIVKMQLVTSELEPCVTGDEPFDQLINQLSKYQYAQGYIQLIKDVKANLRDGAYSVDRLKSVVDSIRMAGIDTSVKTLFQCDLKVTTKRNTVSGKIVDKILQQLNDLVKSSYSKPAPNENLTEFKNKFIDKYEGRTVPLHEVLDVEKGIGYGSYSKNINPFVSDLNMTPDNQAASLKVNDVVQKYLNDAFKMSFDPIHLTHKDLNIDKKQTSSLHFDVQQNVMLMGVLMGNSEHVDEGDFRFYVKSIGGTSHANLLARFGHLDEDIKRWITGLTFAEEKMLPDNTVYAEIVHLPQERLGNVLTRPHLRTYEIPYLGNSSVATECQLPISDLLITVEQGEIILLSKKLNKKVIPRLTNAHNFSVNALPIYQFLCEMQFVNAFGGIGWQQMINTSAYFTPRITYENLILKRASWKITKEDVLAAPKDEAGLNLFFKELRAQKYLPERVVLVESDNELFIDFTHTDCQQILMTYIEKNKTVHLAEILEDEFGTMIKSDLGNYNNEILFPLKIERSVDNQHRPAISAQKIKARRSFMPGDEWLYYKIYCSHNTGEQLLANVIPQVVRALSKKGLIEKFFFIRYTDPEFHLRVRFKLNQQADINAINNIVRKALAGAVKTGHVEKLQIDTYVRELERYGNNAIDLSESIFYYDSIAVMSIIGKLHEHDEEGLRWQLALAGIDAYLNDCGFSNKDKLTFISVLQKGFFKEFGGGLALQRSLNDKSRVLKDTIFSIFKSNEHLDKYKEEFSARSVSVAPMIAGINRMNGPKAFEAQLPSILHMFINRFFPSENRKYELTLYHLLLKYYSSLQAIQEKAVAI